MFKESKLQFVSRIFKATFGPLAVVACVIAGGQNAYADVVIDLTTAGSSGSAAGTIGGTFVVEQISPQSTGTGVIDPFLRIQAVGNEGGYNTDGAVEYDAKAGIWTHAIQLSDLASSVVNIGGVSYYRFMLDINQNTGGSPTDPVPNEHLSLNQIQIFQSAGDLGLPNNNQDTLTAATATAPPLISFVGATEVFRMNNATDPNTEILLNYDLNPGSGAGDMFLYVRTSNFANSPSSFITLYSQFGAPPGPAGSNDGFEEWALLLSEDDILVPEPTSLLLFGVALTLGGMRMRRNARKA